MKTKIKKFLNSKKKCVIKFDLGCPDLLMHELAAIPDTIIHASTFEMDDDFKWTIEAKYKYDKLLLSGDSYFGHCQIEKV